MDSQPEGVSPLSEQELASLETVKTATAKIRTELGKVIVGQAEVIDQLVMAIFSQGHCLLEGVPGLAKTLMVSTLAKSMKLDFSRVQFTPDLMPSDITGTEVIQEDKVSGAREFRFIEGPNAPWIAGSVFRVGDSESDRARGDLHLAGGAARPLYVQGLCEVSRLR